MNQHLQNILNTVQQDKNLSEEEKNTIIKSLKDADKEFEITNFKLDRTEKVKRTTAILLEETIEELEQKRKAVEAQNKELEIEASLERVRAVAMSMMKADDLLNICKTQFSELLQLGFIDIRNALIGIYHDEENYFTDYDYSDYSGGNIHKIPYNKNSLVDRSLMRMKSAVDAFTEFIVEGKELEDWKAFRKENGEYDDTRIDNADVLYYYFYSINQGNIGISTFKKISEDQLIILKRFRNVFDLAYRRYVDISNAEAQAREAQIEVAVERVRAQSMAMHQTTDLDNVNKELFNQLQWLKVDGLSGVSIYFLDEEGEVTVWDLSSPGNIGDPNSYAFKFSSKKYPVLGELWQQFKKSGDYFTMDFPLEKLKAAIPEFREIDNTIANIIEEAIKSGSLTHQWNAFGKISNGVLGIDLMIPPSDDTKTIVLKMAGAFNLAYKRFLDLQKAEAQAREAKIEVSLERVRAKAMSMHRSEDLHAAVAVVFEELEKLDIGVLRCGISVLNKEKRCGKVWLTSTDQGKAVQVTGDESFDIHPLLHGAFEAWLNQEDFYYVLEGEDLVNYYKAVKTAEFMLPESQLLISDTNIKQHCFVAVYNSGGLFAFREIAFTEEAKKIMRRFASVFDLTYKRFLDLQKAEAQAREAQIETALERVRSRTLAMQKSDELAETAAVLFQQLMTLGIEPNRLYISIIQDEHGKTEFWITDEDGSKVSTAYTANLNDNPTFSKMYEGWKQQRKSLVIDMHGEELETYFRHLTSLGVPFKGGLTQKRRVQDIAYFSKGFIGMASPDEQPAETLQLLERFAYVFNLTFTRFNDLQVAEAHAIQAEQDLISIKEAKQKAEETLTELQATQKQLIQSEKMASLGELTAGIAHEIQNPLNFVNNFSEVSVELIQEMVDEVEKGNTEEAKAIANDLIQNLEKINHHGKRADAIVKGMLQHSRATSATKEPTDINKLADEYLRLAYHGLRAKDKSFNATLKTDFDETIGNINIIPQDIGRVILNLITNAFYVVGEKKKQVDNTYEPIVSVSTKSSSPPSGGRGVSITIADNGSGIPKNILDKIFQPFFTTKPTGQGTGLGLSLSYDIVKAHGGELKVKTKEGEGSEFIIQLPVV